MTTCGRCGTINADSDLRCVECGDYLHQYRQRLNRPHRIAAVIGLLFSATISGGAFLPWVHVLNVFEARYADRRDGLLILAAALCLAVASILTLAGSNARMLRVVAVIAGGGVLAILAIDVSTLRDRALPAIKAVNDVVSSTLPQLGTLGVLDFVGSGIWVMLLGALGAVALGLAAPGVRKERITESAYARGYTQSASDATYSTDAGVRRIGLRSTGIAALIGGGLICAAVAYYVTQRATTTVCMTSFYEAPGGDTVASFDIPSAASRDGYDEVLAYFAKDNRQAKAVFQSIVRSNPIEGLGDSDRLTRGVTVSVRFLRNASKPESTYGAEPVLMPAIDVIRVAPKPLPRCRVWAAAEMGR